MALTHEQELLLTSDERESIERKASHKLRDEIRDSILAFANDLSGRGAGWIIIGQEPDKTIRGLSVGDDEIQRILSDIARNQCTPAVAISIDVQLVQDKRIAFVEVRASLARPHFAGRCVVRIGSTNRQATDAEIIALRYVTSSPKLARLARWLSEGKTLISMLQLHRDPRGACYETEATLLEVTESYIVLRTNPEHPVTLPTNEFEIGYDYKRSRPMITYFMRPLL